LPRRFAPRPVQSFHHADGRANEGDVVAGRPTGGEDRGVLEAGADAVTPRQRAPVQVESMRVDDPGARIDRRASRPGNLDGRARNAWVIARTVESDLEER
jgi:hypothetical protein